MKYQGVLESDKVLLRPLTEADIEQVRVWRNSEHTRKWFIDDVFITEDQQKKWYERYLKDDQEIIFLIEEKEEIFKPIGMVALYNMDFVKNEVEFGKIFIGEESARGKGYGSLVVKMVIDFAFNHYQFSIINLEVLKNNIRGIHTYEKLGFKIINEKIVGGKKLLQMRMSNPLKQSINKLPRVLAFCFLLIPSAIVGVVEPLRYLDIQGLLNFQYMNSQDVTDEVINASDILVCIRGAENRELEIVEKAFKAGKKIIYYLDDDLLNIDATDTYNYKYFSNPQVVNNIINMMKLSQYFWTNNTILVKKYGYSFRDIILIDAPALLLTEHKNAKKTNEIITIGYAGGMDHRSFFEEILYEPIEKILKSHGHRINIQVLGFEPYYMHHLDVDFFPYIESYQLYMDFMHSRKWDIALAPLPDSPFHECKYFNKFLEYGAIGAAGIYSRVSPFTQIIEDGINGLSVSNDVLSWYNAIVRLIEDNPLRSSIAYKAENQLREKFTLNVVTKELLNKIKKF